MNPSLAWMKISPPVDVFDATARLEASGTGDLRASRNGFADVFDQARNQFKPPAVDERVPVARPRFSLSVWRALALLSGMLLCLALLSTSVGPIVTFGAGAGCWLSAQVTSSVLWWGRNEVQQPRAARAALGILAIELAFATGISINTGDATVAGWTLWGWASAVGICWLPTRKFSVSCCLGAMLVWAARIFLDADTGAVIGAAFVLGAVIVGVWALIRTDDVVTEPVEGMGVAAAWAMACVIAQLSAIGLAYRSLGTAFIALAVGAIISTALSESSLEATGYLVKSAVTRMSSWRGARILSTAIGLCCVALMGTASVLAGVTFAIARGIPITGDLVVLSALLSAVSTGIGLSMRLGSAITAALIAVGGALLTGIVTSGFLGTSSFVGLVATAGAALFSASRMSSPRAW